MLHVRPGSFWEHARLFSGRAFTVVGFLATLISLFPLFYKGGDQMLLNNSGPILGVVATLGIIAGLFRLFQPSRIEFTAAGSGLKFEIKSGNFFDETGHIAIPVNDFFDTEIGIPVSATTIHGQFIQRFYGTDEAKARREIDAALRKVSAVGQVDPAAGKRSTRYAVGQTCSLGLQGRTAVLVALTSTDASTRQVSASLEQYVGALNCLWAAVRACCNHQTISVPLMGGGPARLDLPPHQLADLIVMTAVREHRKQAVASKIVLVLRKEDLAKVDVFQLKRRYG